MIGRSILLMWFYGGFVAAFLCLLFVTLCRPSRGLKSLCLAAAICGLIYEGGCFAVASSFGNATGGGTDDSWKSLIGIAFVILLLWSVVIIYLPSANKDKADVDKKGPDNDSA